MAAAGTIAICTALAIGAAPAAVAAAPKAAPKPTSIQIEGKGLDEILVVDQSDRPRLFETLIGEVGWMAGASPSTTAPNAAKLGAKYVLTVMIKTEPAQVYELYPLAAGGPRAHRPANQPSGKKADGWFYGRFTMQEALRLGGVPIEAKSDVVNGGIGAGIGEDINDAKEIDPVTQVNNMVDQLRRVLLLNGAVLMVVLVGLGGMAFMVRRRI